MNWGELSAAVGLFSLQRLPIDAVPDITNNQVQINTAYPAFSPEDVGWFKILRQQTTTSLAMGELFVNRNEWLPLVSERLIDFIRIHQSAAGGLNQCRKIAACCEFFNVRTAWHGPGPGNRSERGARRQIPLQEPGWQLWE